jgi:radical SAM protein with 4Fe4S-binding SPASM domain
MCYVHLSKDEADKRGRELTADEWLGIAEAARAKGLLFVLLTGGEPLIRPDFKYIYTELHKMGLMVSINTNGSLIDGEYFEFFRSAPPMRFNISLYGTSEETYESLCGNRSYGKVIETIKRLHEAGMAVKLNVLFGPSNVDDMDAINRVSNEVGIPIKPTTYLYPPVRVDGGHGDNKARFSPEKAAYYEVMCDKQRFDHETFVKRTAAICRGIKTVNPDEDCEGIPSEGIMCRAGRSSFWMTWDGRMMPCGMMLEPVTYPLRDGFNAAWDELRQKAAEVMLPHECVTCSVRHACHICAASAYAETGRFDGKPQYICDMIHETVRLYKEEYAAFEKSGDLDKYAKEVGAK